MYIIFLFEFNSFLISEISLTFYYRKNVNFKKSMLDSHTPPSPPFKSPSWRCFDRIESLQIVISCSSFLHIIWGWKVSTNITKIPFWSPQEKKKFIIRSQKKNFLLNEKFLYKIFYINWMISPLKDQWLFFIEFYRIFTIRTPLIYRIISISNFCIPLFT